MNEKKEVAKFLRSLVAVERHLRKDRDRLRELLWEYRLVLVPFRELEEDAGRALENVCRAADTLSDLL